MNKIITSITSILLIGNSVTNFGAAAINSIGISDITKVYAQETDGANTTSEMIPCGDSAYYTITDNGTTMTITGTGSVYNICYDGKKIKKLIVENGITCISQRFTGYDNLESVSLADSVDYIFSGVFDDTPWYDNQPEGIVYAGKVAYKYKGEMKENTDLRFREDTTGIAEKAFYECSEIKSVVFPQGITKIPYLSFYNCANLTSVTIPDSVEDIGAYAFFKCYSLEEIVIPDSVTSMGSSAFGDCFMLEDITFPDSAINMGDCAFNGTSWYYNQPDGIVYAGKTAYCCNGTMATIEIKEGTKSIASGAFKDCNFIKSVIIPDSVTNAGYNIFAGCTNLQKITFSNNMTAINGLSFYECNSLKSVIIPESIKYIGDSAFYEVPELESVVFLSEELDIDYAAFNFVPNLTDIYYVGSEEDWKQKVSIELDNENLKNARFHFNYSPSTENTDTVPDGKVKSDDNVIPYGDINKDQIIDLGDLIKLSQYLLRDTALDANALKAADVSGDGIVDILDLAVLKQYICLDDIKLGPKM